MDYKRAIRFFMNGFSALQMVAEELDPLLPAEYGDTFEISAGSWVAEFRKDGDDLLANYSDSGGNQGWVRISDDGFGFQVTHSDWERCYGDYTDEDPEFGQAVLRTLWNEVDGEWGCWAVQRLGWDDEETGDFERIVRPPYVLDQEAAYTAHMEATEGPDSPGSAEWRAANPLPASPQDTVPVHILTAGQFDGKKCEYSTGITVHTIQKFVAWSPDATDLQVCTRPDCIEKLCVEADKNRADNLPKADLENGPSANDPGLDGATPEEAAAFYKEIDEAAKKAGATPECDCDTCLKIYEDCMQEMADPAHPRHYA